VINRVWKRTFYKIGYLLAFTGAIVGYVVGTALIGHYFFHSPEGGLVTGLVGVFVFIIGNTIYKDAKREIENENDQLMRQLRLDEAKKRLDNL
jgi:hypothetical protein